MFDCNYQAVEVQCYIAGAYISHLTQNPDVVSSGLVQLLLGHLLSYSVTILGTVAFIPATPPRLPHDHVMAVDSLAILSVFQAEQKGRPKGKMIFFFFSGKTCFILRNTVPSLGLLPTFHWPEMSRVATLAIAESRTSVWLSSLYNRSGLRRRGSGKGWVNILACLPHSSPWLGWTVLEGTAPALSLGWGMNWWSEEWPSFLWKGGGFPGSKSSRPGAEQGSRRLNAAWIGEEMGQDSRTLSSQWAGRNVSFREKEGEEAGVFCDLSQGGAQSGYL